MPFPTYLAGELFVVNTSGYLTLDDATDGRLDTGQLLGEYPEAGWTSLQSRLYGFTAQHGRADERSGVTAGTLSLSLDDDDGAFDPEYASSPYYPNVQLNKRVRAQATWNAITYTLSDAFTDAYEPTTTALGAAITLRATDLFKRLARFPLYATYPPQQTDVRIGAILDALNWPLSKRSLDAGHLQLPGVTLDGVSALQHIDQIIRAERGNFFIKGDGTATFHSRYYRQLVTSRGTFGAGSALPVVLVEGAYTEEGMTNVVSIKLTDGSTYSISDAASQKQHGEVPYGVPDETAELLGEDAARQDFAQAILAAQKQPVARIRAVGLDANAGGTTYNTLWPHILAAEVGEKITLTHSLPGTRGVTATDFFIESVTHEMTVQPLDHRCVWGVSKAPAMDYFRLDDATFGKLDTGTLGG